MPGSHGGAELPDALVNLGALWCSVLDMIGRIVIEDIRPQVDCGQFTTRAVAGETVPVSATIFRDGHNEVVAAAVRLTGPGDRRGQLLPLVEVNHGLHQWQGEITLPRT